MTQEPKNTSNKVLMSILAAIIIIILLMLGLISLLEDDSGAKNDDDNSAQEQKSSRPVTILVVDDFGDHVAELAVNLDETSFQDAANQLREYNPEGEEYDALLNQTIGIVREENRENAFAYIEDAIESPIDESNCYAIPEGQGFFNTGGAGFFNTGGAGFFNTGGAGSPTRAPHGERVYAEFEELVAKYAGTASIELVKVDTDGFSTDVIAQRIEEAINAAKDREPDTAIVINMSFAVIPCTDLTDILIYERLMREFNPDEADDLLQLQKLFQNLLDDGVYKNPLNPNDPLSNSVAEFDESIVVVAAAGNGAQGTGVGADFPYFPAAFGGVISISASEDNADFVVTTGRDTYSNSGAIIMPGRWSNPAGFVELGTSFAAPRYSFQVAMSLAGANLNTCPTSATLVLPLPDDWTTGALSAANVPLCP